MGQDIVTRRSLYGQDDHWTHLELTNLNPIALVSQALLSHKFIKLVLPIEHPKSLNALTSKLVSKHNLATVLFKGSTRQLKL